MALKTARPPTGRTNLDTRGQGLSQSSSRNSLTLSRSASTGILASPLRKANASSRSPARRQQPLDSSRRYQVTRPMPAHSFDTERIAHELEWDDKQLDEEGMTTTRLNRAKAVAAHHLASTLHRDTWDHVPELRDLTADQLVDKMLAEKNFAKHYRRLKLADRRNHNQGSHQLHETLDLTSPELASPRPPAPRPGTASFAGTKKLAIGQTSSRGRERLFTPSPSGRRTMHLPESVTNPAPPAVGAAAAPPAISSSRRIFEQTKPHVDEAFRATLSQCRTRSHLRHAAKQENLAAARAWLAKDRSYGEAAVGAKPFNRVNAFYRSAYVGRDGVSEVADPFLGRQSEMDKAFAV